MIYFTADTHFFSRKGCHFVGEKQFSDEAQRTGFLVRRWNETVQSQDEIYILGDFSDGTAAQTNEILRCLNGKKYLVRGNNDDYIDDPAFDNKAFVWCRDYFELRTRGTKWVLFHFPIEAWSGYKNDRIHLHGHLHSHRPMRAQCRKYEVGVDANGGAPVSIETIERMVTPYHNPPIAR